MSKTKKRKHAFPRATKAEQRVLVTRYLVRVISRNYGHDEDDNNIPWVTDEVKGLARTLRKLTPRNGW